ncbi:MAG: hypothetical protein MK130_10430 [Puniceicoccaceae bacterium]|nr:hypothetical protein [Puniceicoccaceae bacterium]NRA28439.1 hypothetical protein [Opitutales bacterium]
MSFDPYCRLYLQSPLEKAELLKQCAHSVGGTVSGSVLENELLVFDLKSNDDFDEDRFTAENRFVFAKYTAEIEGIDFEVSEDDFIDTLCKLIVALRASGILVSASCDFEETVVEKTGWNWTESSPHHP